MATTPPAHELMWQMQHISDNKTRDIITANAVCFTIACVAVILRFTSRRIANVQYGNDDWLIIVGLFFTLGVVITSLLGVRYGSGRHVVAVKDPFPFAKVFISALVLWSFAITMVKGSILLMYHRIFSNYNRPFTIQLWIVGIFIVGYCLTHAFASLFGCIPMRSFWTIGIKRHCVNQTAGATIISALNVLTEIIILILPMPQLYKMQKPLGQKLQIMGLFLLGGLVCFASIFRTVVTSEFTFSDPTWSNVPSNIWGITELCVGILSACLPTMRPLLRPQRYTSRFTAESGSGSGSGSRNLREKGGETNVSHQRLTVLTCQQSESTATTPATPSQLKEFSHIGVLGSVERGSEEHV